MIVIVDYGMGNLGSIANMLKKLKVKCTISSDLFRIAEAEKIILPGVGAFDTAIKQIDKLGLREVLLDFALTKEKPLLGICLGMQLLMDSSEEGILPGLGLIKGRAHHFKAHITGNEKVPHMGWNDVSIQNKNEMTQGFEDDARFYFVHSFFVQVENAHHSMMRSVHGIEFDAGVRLNNIVGVQFHPEKSHKYGKQLFENFANN